MYTGAPPTAVQFNQELHDELIGMLKRDQSEQADGPAGEGAAARTERLQAIIRRGRTVVRARLGERAGRSPSLLWLVKWFGARFRVGGRGRGRCSG